MSNSTHTSLLWLQGESEAGKRHWQNTSISDLGLEPVIGALNVDGKHEATIKAILLSLCDDPETLRYRQAIIEDLLRAPDLLEQFERILPLVSDLAFYASMSEMQNLPFQKALARLGELELYIHTICTFREFLDQAGDKLQSQGLCALRDLLRTRIEDPDFQRMQRELPDIAAKIRDLHSITLGINLDHNLKPIGATLLSVNGEPFKGSGLFKKLFGERSEFQGIAQLHTVPMKVVAASDGRIVPTQERNDPMLYPLFKDLDQVIAETVRPVAAALKNFLHISTRFLAVLEPEIAFYLGAIRLITDLQKHGLPICRPEIADIEARIGIIDDCYNLNLALRTMFRSPNADLSTVIVGSDVRFDDENGRVFIVTGPNQGGKTTYIQAIALAQILFQAGMYVPGRSAILSPVDGIYTHFPVEEKPNAEAGRFGEEAQRLGEIFKQATRCSLVLLNESLSSTAEGESLYLARNIVRCLRLLGVRAAYTTHMHELAASADDLNQTTPGDSKVVSLVAMAQPAPAGSGDGVKRTFKIVASPPMGRSFAEELAAKYGISYDKIVATLTERRVIKPEDGEAAAGS